MSIKTNKINWEKVNETLEANNKGTIYIPYGFPDFVNPYGTVFADAGVVVDPKWNLPKKVTVSTALTGAMYNKRLNPNLPETREEILKSAREVIKAGCTSVHIHVRDEDRYNMPDLNYDSFHAIVDPLREEFPHVAFDGCIVPSDEKQWNDMIKLAKENFFDICIVNTLAAFNGDSLFAKPPHLMIEKKSIN
jgi:3-keto-5-aminohexanoate cleavage enzyme